MSAAASPLNSLPSFERSLPDDTAFYREALGVFLRQSGRPTSTTFLELNRQEQSVVLLLSQKLKQEAQR